MKKMFAVVLAVLLMVTGVPVLAGSVDEGWSVFETNLGVSLQDLEYNGSVYIAGSGSTVFFSKDAVNWTEISIAESAGAANSEVKEIFLAEGGSLFMLKDTSGKFFKSGNGVTWSQADPAEADPGYQAEFDEGYVHVVKDKQMKSWAAPDLKDAKVQKAKMINENVMIFALDSQDAKRMVIYRKALEAAVANKVKVNGKVLSLDTEPTLVDDRMLVPFRAIVEAMGGNVDWDGTTSTVTAQKGDIRVELQIENAVARVNGKEMRLDVPAKLINNRTLIPIRFISESLGAEVIWDYLSNTAVVNYEVPKEPVVPVEPVAPVVPATGATAPTTPSTGGGSADTAKEQLKAQIVNEYSSKASTLGAEGIDQINAIIDQARSEFYSLPASERTEEMKDSLYQQLLPQAEAIDQEIRNQFDAILEDMVQELEENNLSSADAVQTAKAQYDQQRLDMINQLMNQL